MLHATEGVWGLACDPFNESTVARLLVLKGRRLDKGLIVIGDSAACFETELALIDGPSRLMVEESWPGAVTWILPNGRFPFWITGGRHQVAVRVPAHAQARALCQAFGGPLVSTSANRSSQPPAVNALQARGRFSGAAFPLTTDYMLPGEICAAGGPSRIRTLSGDTLRGG